MQNSTADTKKKDRLAIREEKRTLAAEESKHWKDLVSEFNELVGEKSLELHWKQGKIVAQINDEFQGKGLTRLSEETGLATRYIQEVWRFYKTFSDENWNKEQPYKLHAAIAWIYQIAVLRNPGFEKGRSPKEWLEIIAEKKWSGPDIEQRMFLYYGLVSNSELKNLKEIILESCEENVDIHPAAKREILTRLNKTENQVQLSERSFEENKVVKSTDSRPFKISYHTEITAKSREDAWKKLERIFKKGEISKEDFMIQ